MSVAMYWVLRKLISLQPGLTLHKHKNISGLCVFDIGHLYRRHEILFLPLYFSFNLVFNLDVM